MRGTLALLVGFLLDCLLGDPAWLYHPVRAMGWFIDRWEKAVRPRFPATPRGEIACGAAMAAALLTLAYGIPWLLLWAVGTVSGTAAFLLECVFCWLVLAPRSLRDESLLVYRELARGDLPAARTAVSRIVGRDTAALTAEQVAKAAVETVAENTSDGVVAPLFFLALGGAPLGFFYKAINTMDSMVGYKEDRYLHFGRIPARLDDLANYLPARLSALLMVAAAFLLGLDGRGAARIWRRDRRNHASPNSAQTEAACAGALGVQLAGDASYFGVVHHKSTLGDSLRPVEAADILRSHRLLYGTTALALLLGMAAAMMLPW